jgi:hypothetical protein
VGTCKAHKEDQRWRKRSIYFIFSSGFSLYFSIPLLSHGEGTRRQGLATERRELMLRERRERGDLGSYICSVEDDDDGGVAESVSATHATIR